MQTSPSELVDHWLFRSARMQNAHYTAARGFETRHLVLGIMAVAFGAFVGTAVFASLAEHKNDPVITIVVGMFSVLTVVLSALQTFLKYSESAEKHRIAGARFAKLRHKLEIIRVMPPKTEDELKKLLTDIEDTWGKVREESPNIPKRVWRSTKSSMEIDSFVARKPPGTIDA